VQSGTKVSKELLATSFRGRLEDSNGSEYEGYFLLGGGKQQFPPIHPKLRHVLGRITLCPIHIDVFSFSILTVKFGPSCNA
jgi:hypothetical protein